MTPYAPPIAAHRLLGDGQATALLRPCGEIDWWCAPDMDSAPLLWSLLDEGGAAARWSGVRLMSGAGRPAGSGLSTVLQSPRGRLECLDGLLRDRDGGSSLVRLVRGLDDDLDLEHELALGGFDQAWATWGPTGGAAHGAVVGDLRLRVLGPAGRLEGHWLRTRVRAPRREWAGLCVTLDAELGGGPEQWRAGVLANVADDDEFVARARLPAVGTQRCGDALRVLRQCTYTRTGAVVAAPTTSLPEARGHDRNFDYRYTWLRDASLAVSVAAQLGRADLAERYLGFVVEQTRDRQSPSGPMTDLRGATVPVEREVPGVAGWAGSLPVRVGNGAAEQRQYDAFGLLLEAVSVFLQQGGPLTRPVWELVRGIADELSDDGLDRTTSGIWELREPAPLVSADIGVWMALDRALAIARTHRPWTRRRHWVAARRRAHERVLAALQDDGGLPQAYGEGPGSADASALMAVIFRMFDRDDPRAGRLVDATVARLDAAPYLYRYEPGGDDGFGGVEGAFVPVSWWVVSALAACGRLDEARARAEQLDRVLPALLPEEIDPESREGLGNAPLVWSHMEAARAMYLLDTEALRDRWGALGPVARRAWHRLSSRQKAGT